MLNEKGGVGKTTTAVNVAYNLADYKKNVWLIDYDGSFNATTHLDVEVLDNTKTSWDLQNGTYKPNDLINVSWKEYNNNSIMFVPSDQRLRSANAYSFGVELNLKRGLDKLIKDWIKEGKTAPDYIIIDSCPTQSVIQAMSILAASEIFLITQCQFLSLEGMRIMIDKIKEHHKTSVYKPALTGIIATMKSNTNLSGSVLEKIEQSKLKRFLFNTKIRYNTSIAEAPAHGLPVNLSSPNSFGAEDYRNLVKDIIKRGAEK
jgi:chromosome partitioning protein